MSGYQFEYFGYGMKDIKTMLYILIGIAAITLILTIWNTIKKK